MTDPDPLTVTVALAEGPRGVEWLEYWRRKHRGHRVRSGHSRRGEIMLYCRTCPSGLNLSVAARYYPRRIGSGGWVPSSYVVESSAARSDPRGTTGAR